VPKPAWLAQPAPLQPVAAVQCRTPAGAFLECAGEENPVVYRVPGLTRIWIAGHSTRTGGKIAWPLLVLRNTACWRHNFLVVCLASHDACGGNCMPGAPHRCAVASGQTVKVGQTLGLTPRFGWVGWGCCTTLVFGCFSKAGCVLLW
jgi:hypothetical protein